MKLSRQQIENESFIIDADIMASSFTCQEQVSILQDRLYFLEYKINKLVVGRRMRPGKAVKKVFPFYNDDRVQALTLLWDCRLNRFSVSFGCDEALWEKAYTDVRSCMKGFGADCCASYSRVGGVLAVCGFDKEFSGRAIVWNNTYNRFYGPDGHKLAVLLSALGLRVSRIPCAVLHGIYSTSLVEKEESYVSNKYVEGFPYPIAQEYVQYIRKDIEYWRPYVD